MLGLLVVCIVFVLGSVLTNMLFIVLIAQAQMFEEDFAMTMRLSALVTWTRQLFS